MVQAELDSPRHGLFLLAVKSFPFSLKNPSCWVVEEAVKLSKKHREDLQKYVDLRQHGMADVDRSCH